VSVQTTEQSLNNALLAYDTNVKTAEQNLAQAEVNLDNAILTAKNTLSTVRRSASQKITAAESKVESALEALNVAKAQYQNVKAPASSQDIALQNAQLKQAQAYLDTAANSIQNSILKAPIHGTVIKIEYAIGEMVSVNKPVIVMLNEHDLEIEVDISESDISKISVDDKVEITLDAFSDDVKFYGKVFSIEPAETVIQDVIYYNVTISCEFSDEYFDKVKPGMTANVIITTVERDNVLTAPTRAIVNKNGEGKVLRILKNGIMQEIPIEVGIRGDEGVIEVLLGVEDGTEVVVYIKEKK
ncbi:MAG: efflux RND transporter periplasmic adaptor subunit, partial [Candidatus Aenigmarchaeota archaeon]|nr:efflux RND transporter periplasmic adaptor subunit [Candidatus Aenigmarchaeota archaeon]